MSVGFERFERLIEVVTFDEADRQRARERWKHYKTAGCEPLRHDLKIAGSAS
jgi:DNA polymerase-3 subunit chi